MSDLATFLGAIRRSKQDDTPRLVFADWLDENHPHVEVKRATLPTGFNAHWHQHVISFTLGVRDRVTVRGKWSNTDILAGLAASGKQMRVNWSARIGAAEIGGYPVLVSEPQMTQDQALVVCRALQWAAGGCPVSFNRCTQAGRLRVAIWFTAMAPPEESNGTVAEAMENLFRNVERGIPKRNLLAETLAVLQPKAP